MHGWRRSQPLPGLITASVKIVAYVIEKVYIGGMNVKHKSILYRSLMENAATIVPQWLTAFLYVSVNFLS